MLIAVKNVVITPNYVFILLQILPWMVIEHIMVHEQRWLDILPLVVIALDTLRDKDGFQSL